MSTLSYLLLAAGSVLGVFIVVFAQSHLHNKPLKIRRKRLRIMLYLLLLILFLTLIVGGIIIHGSNMNNLVKFWKETFSRGFICQLILIVILFLYAYFRKDKSSEQQK
jgi:hypothetical protein